MTDVARGAPDTALWDALAIHPDDDVAVALRDLAAKETIKVRCGDTVTGIAVSEAIPLGHKLALHPVAAGAPIRTYGQCIGEATAAIAAGAHVHVHNMASRRARRKS
jgi:hypothetical protein